MPTPRDQTTLPLQARAKTAIGYVRVSGPEQVRDGLSLTVQARRIRDYADALGLRLVEVVADPGVTASRPIAKRPGGRRIVGAIEGGEVGVLIATRLDRVFRTTLDCLNTVASWRTTSLAIHIVDDGSACLDTTSPMGQAVLTMRVAFAQLERQFASARTRDVVAYKRSLGQHHGGKVPLGYRVVDGLLVEDAEEQDCLRAMRELWDEGRGMCPWAIARHFEALVPHPRGSRWTSTQVKRALPGYKSGARPVNEYPEAMKRRVQGLRKRGVMLADIGRQLVREGYEPLGETFHSGSLSKIARRG